MDYMERYTVNPEIRQITTYSSQRVGGIIQNSLSGARFIQNSLLGVDYTSNNPLFLLKEGATLTPRKIEEFILELEELKHTLEATDLMGKMSKE